MFVSRDRPNKRKAQSYLTNQLFKTDGLIVGLSGPNPIEAVKQYKEKDIGSTYFLFEEDPFTFNVAAHKLGSETRYDIPTEAVTSMRKNNRHINSYIPTEMLALYKYIISQIDKPLEEVLKEINISEPTYQRYKHSFYWQYLFSFHTTPFIGNNISVKYGNIKYLPRFKNVLHCTVGLDLDFCKSLDNEIQKITIKNIKALLKKTKFNRVWVRTTNSLVVNHNRVETERRIDEIKRSILEGNEIKLEKEDILTYRDTRPMLTWQMVLTKGENEMKTTNQVTTVRELPLPTQDMISDLVNLGYGTDDLAKAFRVRPMAIAGVKAAITRRRNKKN
jgi:hypothetical protein